MAFLRLIWIVTLLLLSTGASAIELTAASADGTELAGTLHVPEGASPFPVVVFTHGAEPGERRQEGYLRWARPFVARGIGVLVFDKRGCGDSKGSYVEAPDLEVPAADLIAWVDLLSARDDVTSVGVLGWSQGGWVGPLAASRSDAIEFVVAISGPGVSPLEQNIYDKTNQFAATGASPKRVQAFERTIRLVWTYLVTGRGRRAAEAAWAEVAEEAWFRAAYHGPPMMDRDGVLSDPRMTHYVAHSSYDPVPAFERIHVPLLAVFGEEDTVVPVPASIAAMRKAFDRADGDLTVKVVPGANHGLGVGGHLAKGYPDAVVEWVRGVLAPKR
jgi:pimeloyl-ACP methyl ester carboxylesterase